MEEIAISKESHAIYTDALFKIDSLLHEVFDSLKNKTVLVSERRNKEFITSIERVLSIFPNHL